MRQSLILPPVQAEVYAEVIGCPYAGCGCSHVLHWQGGGLLRRARGVGAFGIVDQAVVAGNDLLLYVIFSAEPSALTGHLAGRMQNGEIAADRVQASVARLRSMQLVALN